MSQSTPSETVRAFLTTMEARDLETAQGFLAEGFTMTFPGNAVFSEIPQLIEWSRDRYNSVAKTYDRFDEAPQENGQVVVYCYGTLFGEWLDGSSFEGIRFIDRFTVADGKLVDQRVWNDMAEIQAIMAREA